MKPPRIAQIGDIKSFAKLLYCQHSESLVLLTAGGGFQQRLEHQPEYHIELRALALSSVISRRINHQAQLTAIDKAVFRRPAG